MKSKTFALTVFCTVLALLNLPQTIEQTSTNAILTSRNVVGASIVTVHGQEIQSIYFGFADKKQNEKVNAQTRFQAASVSKSLTAYAVLLLVERGTLDLDTPVEQYLGDVWHIPNAHQYQTKVTLRHLLNHTSGLSVDGYLGFDNTDELPTTLGSLDGELGSHSIWTYLYNRALPSRENVHLLHEPGSQFLYSGGGYTVLQLIIEQVTQQDFARFMAQEVLQPLGMRNSAFALSKDIENTLATPYVNFLWEWSQPQYIYRAQAAAGLYTTAEDLAQFVRALMRKSDFLLVSDETLTMMRDQLMGIFSYGNDDIFFGHSGQNMGQWNSGYRFSLQYCSAIIVLTNSSQGDEAIEDIFNQWEKSLTDAANNE